MLLEVCTDLLAVGVCSSGGFLCSGALAVFAPGSGLRGVSKGFTHLHLEETSTVGSQTETTAMSAARAKGREGSPHRHSRGVHEALVEVVQSAVRVLLGFKSHKAKLAELAVLGELQRAVRHCAEGSKHRLEPLLLHLQARHTDLGEPTQNVTALGR